MRIESIEMVFISVISLSSFGVALFFIMKSLKLKNQNLHNQNKAEKLNKDIVKLRALIEAQNERLAELNAVEERWLLANYALDEGFFEWNILDGTAFYSSKAKDVLGFFSNEKMMKFSDLEKRIYPEDLLKFKQKVSESVESKTDKFEATFRVYLTEGGVRKIVLKAKTLYSENGEVEKILGSLFDSKDIVKWLNIGDSPKEETQIKVAKLYSIKNTSKYDN